MGTDIYTYVEQLDADDRWREVDIPAPFDWRNYGMFGFLADVRNYSAVPPIDQARGLPADLSPSVAAAAEGDGYYASWLTVHELAAFDYGQTMNDRRITRGNDGGVTGSPEEGTVMTYREFLGAAFFLDVERIAALGDPKRTRIVFWFES